MDATNWEDGQAREGLEVPADVIERRSVLGYAPRRILGRRGTAVVFANNRIHRATLGRDRPRDTLVLRLRPSLERPRELFATSVRLEDTTRKGGASNCPGYMSVRVKNGCGRKLEITICIETASASGKTRDDCGSSTVSDGRTALNWACDSTGRYRFKVTNPR